MSEDVEKWWLVWEFVKNYQKNFHIGGQGTPKRRQDAKIKKSNPFLQIFAKNGSQDGGPFQLKFVEFWRFFVYFRNIVLEEFGNEDGAEIDPTNNPGMD